MIQGKYRDLLNDYAVAFGAVTILLKSYKSDESLFVANFTLKLTLSKIGHQLVTLN